jgi:N-carbamoylputrescine amidase
MAIDVLDVQGYRGMRIALIQQESTADYAVNVERALQRFHQAAGQGAGLVLFPELSFQRFFPGRRRKPGANVISESIPGSTTDRFSEAARKLNSAVVINLYENDGDQFFDTSAVIDADGELKGVTRMIHIMDGPGFHERDYYSPGNRGAPVFDLLAGKIGVAICYDRHFPEYMRALAVKGAQLVLVPQAGAVDEWPPGLFEAELQVASLQNGYFCALANRVGKEDPVEFSGKSFCTDPRGQILCQAPAGQESILYAEIDFGLIDKSPAQRHFLCDRREKAYPL